MPKKPEFSSWFPDVEWQLENHGTEPDIEVGITPMDEAAGRDPQWEKAIAVILNAMDGQSLVPDFGPQPDLGR